MQCTRPRATSWPTPCLCPLQMSDEEVLGGTTQPFCVLKQMRYAGQVSSPEAGLFGAGAHCDWGSWTILATAGPGLQVYFDEAEKWLDVPPQPGERAARLPVCGAHYAWQCLCVAAAGGRAR